MKPMARVRFKSNYADPTGHHSGFTGEVKTVPKAVAEKLKAIGAVELLADKPDTEAASVTTEDQADGD